MSRSKSSVIDWQQLEQSLGGDEDLLREIARLFLEHVDAQLDELRSALASGDAEWLARAGHRVKGSFAQVSAEGPRELAFRMETAGRTGCLEGTATALSDLDRAVSDVKREFEDLLRSDR